MHQMEDGRIKMHIKHEGVLTSTGGIRSIQMFTIKDEEKNTFSHLLHKR